MTCAPTKYDSEPFWLSCARTPRPHLKNQDGVNAQSRRSSAAPPSVRQSRASSDAPDAFSTMSMPASLERSIRRAQRTRWSFPITAFIASSRVKCVSSKYQHARWVPPQQGTHHPPAYAAVTAAPHRPHRGYRLPARCHRGQRLTIPLEASSCPAPGVRRAASPERAASATSVPRRPRRLHRQTSACRAPRTRRAPPPACHSAAVPHRPVTSPLSMSILSAILPRSLTTPPHRRPCAARRVAASRHQRRLRLPR
ncbi:hypothetical protein B0H13DRAFT_1031660 [Mycena leptocephala]|nr:hypothetical protein B0H13DRAFT_1031660 [Mycena leptocephala]